MWNKNTHIIWIKLKLFKRKNFYFPVPLYIFNELLDCSLDLLKILCLPIPQKNNSNSSAFSIHTIKEILEAIIALLNSSAASTPYEFLELSTDKIELSIKIR